MWQLTPGMLKSPAVDGATGGAAPLDGLAGLTGAWSFARVLKSSYGGSLYHLTSSAVDTLYNQEGTAGRDFTDNATAARRPVISTAGPNSRACGDFDGANHALISSACSNFITASAGYAIISGVIDVITTNAANLETNDCFWADTAPPSGGFVGLFFKNGGGAVYTAHAYNWDGTRDLTTHASFPLGSPVVIEWKHSGGNLASRMNMGSWQTVASGNTTQITQLLILGAGTGATIKTDCRIVDFAFFNAALTMGEEDTLATEFKTYIGA